MKCIYKKCRRKQEEQSDYCGGHQTVSMEDYMMIAGENKYMAEALQSLGYNQEQISDIASGAPIITKRVK